MSFKHIAVTIVIAFVAIYIANKVSVIGNLLGQ